jgi:hypothetical protein
MNTWSPLWNSIVDSSIWDEPDYVCKVWITMLAIKDRDHVVRKTAYQLAHHSRKTEKEVLGALKVLSSPDTRRIEPQPFDGRRIQKVDDGWLMLNGEKYRLAMQSIVRKEQKRIWQQDARVRRVKRSKGPIIGETPYVKTLEEKGPEAAEATLPNTPTFSPDKETADQAPVISQPNDQPQPKP